MDRERIEPILASMTESLERGAFPELSFQIDFYGALIRANGCDDAVVRLIEICDQAQVGFDFEKEHGQWSLMKHDHPATVELRKHGFYKDLSSEAA
ncbi:hypothetical protein [Rhizobium sp. Rhizsp42]|uniref:hypothetical protein n=1 Tax=Rhizobium sp. Rhizsp42 TaxID=3243034 RepID=UPI0039AF3D66